MKINPLDWVYDLETYPNVFTASFKHPITGARMRFEISERRNELRELIDFLYALKCTGCRLVGFNNVGYDYPMLHFIIENYQYGLTNADIYNKNDSIINTPWARRFDNVIWDNDTHIPQIDLYKIHHFDNEARSTSLKMLEFNMRSNNIQDLPFPPGTILTPEQISVLIEYNDHDVNETEKFYFESIPLIDSILLPLFKAESHLKVDFIKRESLTTPISKGRKLVDSFYDKLKSERLEEWDSCVVKKRLNSKGNLIFGGKSWARFPKHPNAIAEVHLKNGIITYVKILSLSQG